MIGAIGPDCPGITREGKPGARATLNRLYLKIAIVSLAIASFYVTSCATLLRHEFSEPASNWQTKGGQLMYRTATTTLAGDVLVRFSKSGDFELTFSKGPGTTLLSLRQDASFAEVKGPFAKAGWSGPIDHAPKQLRGWLGLRDKLIHSRGQSVQYTADNETFLFRF
jgi:hypothetical protein